MSIVFKVYLYFEGGLILNSNHLGRGQRRDLHGGGRPEEFWGVLMCFTFEAKQGMCIFNSDALNHTDVWFEYYVINGIYTCKWNTSYHLGI